MNKTTMVTYEESLKKLSKSLIKAGKTQFTEEYIEKRINEIKVAEGYKNKSQALLVLKSDPEIKRAINAGNLEEVSFDVLSIRDGKTTQQEKETNFQAVTIAISKGGKPEVRTALLWDRTVDLSKENAYKGKINIGEGNRFDIPDNATFEKLEKSLFTGADLMKTADAVEDIKSGQAGVWYGTVGSKGAKATAYGSVKVEVSTLGSFQPTPLWVPEEDAGDILKGDDIVFGGYCKTKNGMQNVNADFVMVVAEKPSKVNGDDVLL